MRPSAWVSVLAVSLLTAAVVNGMGAPRPPEAVPAAKPGEPAPSAPSWVVAGDWRTSDEEAVDDALGHARDKVQEYLRNQDPPLSFPLDPTYLRQQMWRNLDPADPRFKALNWEHVEAKKMKGGRQGEVEAQVEAKSFGGLGEMYRAAVLVGVAERNKSDFTKQEEQYQVKQREARAGARQGVLVRVVGALVAVLAIVALYLRLEDATKGYYTTLLRLAVVAFLALVGAGIWLLT
jgi:hypothetical protein